MHYASNTDYICGRCDGHRTLLSNGHLCPQCRGAAIVNVMGHGHTGIAPEWADLIAAEIRWTLANEPRRQDRQRPTLQMGEGN